MSNAQPQAQAQAQAQAQPQSQSQPNSNQPRIQGQNNPQKCTQILKTAQFDAITQMKKEGLVVETEGKANLLLP